MSPSILSHDLPGNGAQVLVVQSSNAMYRGSAQVPQQLAVGARAAELRREFVVTTAGGISGVIDTHGTPEVATGYRSVSGVPRARPGSKEAATLVPIRAVWTAAEDELVLPSGAWSSTADGPLAQVRAPAWGRRVRSTAATQPSVTLLQLPGGASGRAAASRS